jgi:predicted secreted protein
MAQTGTAFKIYLSSSVIAYLRGNELGNSTNMIDISNKESGEYKEVMPGQKEYSGSAEGFVEFINRNILLYSNTFSNAAWDKDSVTVTNENITAPDGSNTASTLAFDAETDSLRQTIVTSIANNDVYVASIWLKASSAGTISLILRSDDESQGTTLVCSVTTEWQRFTTSYTFSGTEAGVEMLLVRNAGNTLTSVIVANAQLEQGTANNTLPTTYQPTPRVNYNDLFTAITNETSYTALMSAKTTGQDAFQGTAYISNLQMASPNAEAQTFTCDIAFSGQLSIV